MKFHDKCGDQIRLSQDKYCAKRYGTGYNNGIVYSARPLDIKKEEIFQLKIKAVEQKWAGALRIGVTTCNPSDISICDAVTDLFRDENHCKTVWIWSGNILHHNKTELPLKLHLHSLVVNDVVGVQVRLNGELHLYHHGNHLGMAVKDLPVDGNEFYVIFDVYGTTTKVVYEPRAGMLRDLCKKVLRQHLLDHNIDKLPLPKYLKQYLKD